MRSQTNRLAAGLASVAAICVVVGGMAAMNEEMREHVDGLLAGQTPLQLSIGNDLRHHVRFITDSALQYASDETPIVFFGAAGLALTVLMLKT